MRRTLKFALLICLGSLSTLVFLLGAEPFEVPGRNSIGEWLGGSVAVVVFFAVCQFILARRDAAAGSSSWPAVTGMLSGLVAAGDTVGRRAGASRPNAPARGA